MIPRTYNPDDLWSLLLAHLSDQLSAETRSPGESANNCQADSVKHLATKVRATMRMLLRLPKSQRRNIRNGMLTRSGLCPTASDVNDRAGTLIGISAK